jgi:hypothetical protein
MAKTTALVLAPRSTTPAAPTKRRSVSRMKPKLTGRQAAVLGVGAAAAGIATAALYKVFGVSPMWGGVVSAAAGGAATALTHGENSRPFAAGVAVGGSAIALTSGVVRHFVDQEVKAELDEQKKEQVANRAPPTAAAPAGGARSAGTVTDEMRRRIARELAGRPRNQAPYDN